VILRKGLLLGGGAVVIVALAVVLRPQPEPEPQAASAMVEVTVPELSGLAAEGRTAFDAFCASCHGENAAGRQGIAAPLVHVVYEPGHHADGAFLLAATRGVRQHHWTFGDMPPVPEASPQDVAAITAYVRELQRANGIF
jgi:mono/diheme cytochrome c family protein